MRTPSSDRRRSTATVASSDLCGCEADRSRSARVMLVFNDEYPVTSPHAGDRSALMKSGEQLKPRYDETPRSWLDRELKGLGVE